MARRRRAVARQRRALAQPDRIVVAELALAAVNVLSLVLAVSHHFWAIALYAAIFATGLGGLALASLHQRRRLRSPVTVALREPALAAD